MLDSMTRVSSLNVIVRPSLGCLAANYIHTHISIARRIAPFMDEDRVG